MSAFSTLIRFFQHATGYVEPDPEAIALDRESGSNDVAYHRRIVQVSAIFGAIGCLSGIVFSIQTAFTPDAHHDYKILFSAPMLFAIVGVLFGVSIACLFAPSEFLSGPVGIKWMRLIGTENVLVARLVCFAPVVLALGFAMMVWFFPKGIRAV